MLLVVHALRYMLGPTIPIMIHTGKSGCQGFYDVLRVPGMGPRFSIKLPEAEGLEVRLP